MHHVLVLWQYGSMPWLIMIRYAAVVGYHDYTVLHQYRQHPITWTYNAYLDELSHPWSTIVI